MNVMRTGRIDVSTRRRAVLLVVAAAAAWAILPSAVRAGDRDDDREPRKTMRVEREIEFQGENQINVHIEFGAGELHVRPGSKKGKIVLDLRYLEGSEEPEVDYQRRGRIGELRLSCDDFDIDRWKGRDHDRWEDEDEDGRDRHDISLDVDDWWDDDQPPYTWTIELPKGVTYSIDLATGASKNEVDLSGLGVENLEIGAGAGKLELRFDEPNPVSGGSLELQGGACEIRALGLGNGRFRSCTLEGGLGKFLLDFRGKPDRDLRAEVDVGLGRLRVRLPRDLGVKLDCGGRTLSGIDVEGLERQGDCYMSRNYGKADHQMVLEISSALGMVEVEVRD